VDRQGITTLISAVMSSKGAALRGQTDAPFHMLDLPQGALKHREPFVSESSVELSWYGWLLTLRRVTRPHPSKAVGCQSCQSRNQSFEAAQV
jgi:hypothetical protein